MADALDYLGENLNIVDKSVREGKATNMDIARSFTGDVKSDKLTENIGLLDFTPIGTYFAGEEADKAITQAEPDKLKRTLSLLSFMNNPVMTTIARPDIGVPAIELGLSTAEAIPFTAVITKPARKFLSSLKAKATEPSKDVGMNIQKTSLPISGEADTTTNIAQNPSRRSFLKDTATLGALGAVTTQIPDAMKMVDNILDSDTLKVGRKAMKPDITFASAQKAFIRPQLKNYLEDLSDNEGFTSDEIIGQILYERVPAFRRLNNEIDQDNYIKATYGIDPNNTSVEEIMSNQKLVDDMSIDVAGDDELDFRYAVQQKALDDGAKIYEEDLIKDVIRDMYEADEIKDARNKAVTDYYNTLKDQGKSSTEIALIMGAN